LLIIFDLDDTLVDTSACVTPVKLEQALCKVQEQGFHLGDFFAALQDLLQMNEKARSAGDALEQFFQEKNIPIKFLQLAKDAVYKTLAKGIEIHQLKGASDVLSLLKKQHELAIVSIGEESQQRFKLEKAGIDTHLFCKILFVEEGGKQSSYESLIADLSLSPKEVLVCGDRIERDLVAAKKLGCITVHMKHGRGRFANSEPKWVDFTITQLPELLKIVSDNG
jgi:putative hydrolase of the HAD superfamily